MKKILLIAGMLVAATGAFAQGTILWNDHAAGTVNVLYYAPQTDNPGAETIGSSAASTPAGSTAYSGTTLGGTANGTGPTAYDNGNLFTAMLFAAAGQNVAVGNLQPITQYQSTFFTVAGGDGAFKTVNFGAGADPGIAGARDTGATAQVRIWYNGGGTITSYADALTAGVPHGAGNVFNIAQLGGDTTPLGPATPPNLTGMQSFSLVSVPEPSTIALGVMGASAFLLRRRSSK